MALGTHAQNYTLGRGELYFGRFKPGTQEPDGEFYIGNTPEFSLTIDKEDLEHFSSDRGIREKDDSVPLQVNRSGALTTDNVVPKNIALFFFGSESTVVDAGGSISETIADVRKGYYYQLGVSTTRPTGIRNLVNPDDSNSGAGAFAATGYTVGTDVIVDYDLGRIYIPPTSTIPDGTDLAVTYTSLGQTFSRVISGSTPVEGCLRFIAVNPKGEQVDYFMPWVQISPNGDYALKADEWQTIPFTIEILKRTTREAIYADGRKVFS